MYFVLRFVRKSITNIYYTRKFRWWFQDLPFYVLRMIMSCGYGVTGYMHTFFLGKNGLVLLIVVYKLIGVYVDRGKKKEYAEIEDWETKRVLAN